MFDRTMKLLEKCNENNNHLFTIFMKDGKVTYMILDDDYVTLLYKSNNLNEINSWLTEYVSWVD